MTNFHAALKAVLLGGAAASVMMAAGPATAGGLLGDVVGTVVTVVTDAPAAIINGVDNGVDILVTGVEGGVSVALAPAQTVYDVVVKGESAERATNEAIYGIKSDVHDVLAMPTAITPLEQELLGVVSPLIGEGATTAMTLVLLPDQIFRALPVTLFDVAVVLTEGQKAHTAADIVAGVPLDAALQSAYDYYKDKAQPLPPKVRNLLASTELFSDEQLNNVRYIVDESGETAPAVVSRHHEKLGADNHAITIDNIIVFAKMPSTNMSEIHFWAHEMRHTVQYREKGSITAFAMAYSSEYQALEDDANDYAKRARAAIAG